MVCKDRFHYSYVITAAADDDSDYKDGIYAVDAYDDGGDGEGDGGSDYNKVTKDD